jgi:hypothetical protein
MSTVELADCPLCNNYSAKPSSVEAHISRSQDQVHKGEVGVNHRDEIRGGSGTAESSTEQGSIEWGGAQSIPNVEEGSTTPDAGTPESTSGTTSEELSGTEDSGEVESVEFEESDEGPVLKLVVTGALAWIVFRAVSDGGGSGSSSEGVPEF